MTGTPRPGDSLRVTTNAPLQPLHIALLGGFRVAAGDCEIPLAAWRLRKAAHLLKLLALAPGYSLHREQLLDALWPNLDPHAAAHNLRYALHVARGVLEAAPASLPRALHVEGERIVLRPAGPLLVDVAAFLAAAAAARRAPTPAAYEAALARYPDDLLPEDRYEDWAVGPRENLRETHLALLGALAGLHEASGALLPAIAALERLTERDPLDDEAHLRLMRLLALTGQRGQALRQYARLRDALHRDLEATPGPEALQLYAAILARRFADPAADRPISTPPSAPVQHNLPAPLTTFVGRSREITEVSALLSQSDAPVPTSDFRLPTFHRLVTLVGAGGCGKTRLALEVARVAATGTAYPDGVWLVDFAVVTDPALLPGAVARAIGVREEPGRPLLDTLIERLRGRAILLVFDNCEHVIDACATLAQALLEGCLRLRILATSREALHLPGELLWRVPPLTLPIAPTAAGAPDSLPLLASEAATLFFERARLVRPDFTIDADNAEALVAICQRLEGLPLALELAAARLAHLSVAQLAARLDNTLQLLTVGGRASAPRQQTLRAALDWSHDLLSAGERALLRRLAAFAGGWTLSAAEAVGAGDEVTPAAVLELLASLVDKSLVVADDEGGEARYRFLEPIRQYAAEQLAASGELAVTRERHAAHYLAFAEEAEPHLRGPAQVAWLGRLERDHDNLRAALWWAIDRGEIALEARLCAALFRFWYVRSHLVEGDAWLTAALDRDGIDEVPALVRAKLLQGAGTLAWSLGQQARSRQLMEAALATFREVGDQPGIAATLHNLGVLAEREGDYERAEALYGESLPLRTALEDSEGAASTLMQLGNVARQQGDRRRAAECYEECLALQRRAGATHGAAMALGSLGNIAHDLREYERAAACFTEALALFRKVGDTSNAARTLNHLGLIALDRGAYREAEAHQIEALRLARDLGDTFTLLHLVEGLAASAARQRQGRRAARLFAAAGRAREESHIPIPPAARVAHAAFIEIARASIGEAAFAAAWHAGQALELDQVVAEALVAEPPPTPAAAQSAPDSLSPREREVAALVAAGHTNAQIAAALGLSARTADTHVSHILHKLGVASRAEIAAWAEVHLPSR